MLNNYPIINLSPDSPCLTCGQASVLHNEGIKHKDTQFIPRWALLQWKTGICTNCNEAPAKGNADWCGYCLSEYWNERPTIYNALVERGEAVFV